MRLVIWYNINDGNRQSKDSSCALSMPPFNPLLALYPMITSPSGISQG